MLGIFYFGRPYFGEPQPEIVATPSSAGVGAGGFGGPCFGLSYFAEPPVISVAAPPLPPPEVGAGIPYELWPQYGFKLPESAKRRQRRLARQRDREREPQPKVIEPFYGDLAGESVGESDAWAELDALGILAGESVGDSKIIGELVGVGLMAGQSEGESESEAELQGLGNIASKPPMEFSEEELALAILMLAGD